MFLSCSAAFAQDVELHDTLATTSSANEIRGGTFTGAGWRVDDSNSRLYWDFGAQLESGDISVTVDDISWDNLLFANNHIIELFSDGGHSSDNRAINLRLYGGGDGDPFGEWGDLKLLGWDRTTNPGGEHLVAEQRYYGLDWDGLPHTWRITWDLTDFVLYRDGVELIQLDVTGFDLRLQYLWIPLQDWGGDYSAPVGALYSNLDLLGWEAGPSETAPPPDDGDATTFLPVEDVAVASWEAGVYPSTFDLAVEGDGAQNTALSWMKFDLTSVVDPIVSATLTLHAREADEANGDGGTLHTGTDSSWSEQTMTWLTRPALGSGVGAYGPVTPGATFDFDVTAVVSGGGPVSFAVASFGANGTHFSSKEDGDGSAAPLLVVITGPPTTGGTGSTPPTLETGSGGGGGTGSGGATYPGQDDESQAVAGGACGCTAGAATSGSCAWLGVVGLVVRRRR